MTIFTKWPIWQWPSSPSAYYRTRSFRAWCLSDVQSTETVLVSVCPIWVSRARIWKLGQVYSAAGGQILTAWNTCLPWHCPPLHRSSPPPLYHSLNTWHPDEQNFPLLPTSSLPHAPRHTTHTYGPLTPPPPPLPVLYPARLAYSDIEALITAQSNLGKHTNRLAA